MMMMLVVAIIGGLLLGQNYAFALKILIVDPLAKSTYQRLEHLGAEIVQCPPEKRIGARLQEIVAKHNPRCMIVRSSKIDRKTLSNSPSLNLIIRAGAGYDNIDIEFCASRGIAVSNTPGCNAVAVAELTLGLMISLDRKLVENANQLGEQQMWNKEELSKGQRGLFNSTLGIIGAGNIGREVIRRAAAFGMPIALWSRTLCQDMVNGQSPVRLTHEQAKGLGLEMAASTVPITLYTSIAQVAAESDILSVHSTQPSNSPPLISGEVLAALKPGAAFINTARADVVDAEELLRALKDPARDLRAALDVWWNEPKSTGPFEEYGMGAIIAQLPNVLPCSHIGAATAQAQAAVADKLVCNVEAFLKDSSILNSVF